MADDTRQYWPATARNREPITEVLKRLLTQSALVLEIASGSGEHGVHFADQLPHLTWQPTDFDPVNLESVAAWQRQSGLPNLRPPLLLDVTQDPWPVSDCDAIFNANMIHIAPWAVCEGLMAGAGGMLKPGAPLIMYGPFQRDGAHTSASNAGFDARLKQRDARWGVRELNDVSAVGQTSGFALEEVVEMPANNLIVVFRRV